MTYGEKQMLVLLARVLYQHAEVTSGAYKERKTQKVDGTREDGTFIWADCTDEEKRSQSLGTMRAHIQFLQDILDSEPSK